MVKFFHRCRVLYLYTVQREQKTYWNSRRLDRVQLGRCAPPVTLTESNWTRLCCYDTHPQNLSTLYKPPLKWMLILSSRFTTVCPEYATGLSALDFQKITQTHFKAQTITQVSRLLTQLTRNGRAFGSACLWGLQ